MEIERTLIPCIGCGGLFPTVEGPTHRYMESSPGCWAAYGKVLAREYGDPAYYRVHRLTVNAYAVQHPGQPSPQSIQSVAVHLISLHLTFEQGVAADQATAAMKAAAKTKGRFRWLEPPPASGEITTADVRRAGSASAHVEMVWAWAEAAWAAWRPHHKTVRLWVTM